jgi:hypothetical protein
MDIKRRRLLNRVQGLKGVSDSALVAIIHELREALISSISDGPSSQMRSGWCIELGGERP